MQTPPPMWFDPPRPLQDLWKNLPAPPREHHEKSARERFCRCRRRVRATAAHESRPVTRSTTQPAGLAESSIVFDLARRIEGRLFALGVSAYLTRGEASPKEGDAERAAFANRSNADLFISIHLDSHQNPQASGVATYFYGNDAHGSHSIMGERFASLVQKEICARTQLLDCRAHAMTWELLRLTKMPAIRVECGYLTSPTNAQQHRSPPPHQATANPSARLRQSQPPHPPRSSAGRA